MRKLGRLALRSIWMSAHVLGVACDFAWLACRRNFAPSLRERALWLHRSAKRTLRVFSMSVEISGPIPQAGLIVSNHVSYADIILLSSITPAIFVSKYEIRYWPVFGWFGRLAGTLFLRRAHRADVGRLSREMKGILEEGLPLVLFPEGTSSDGRQVLPFKSSLLEPVADGRHPVFAAWIGYELADGSVENDVCYWGDMTFFPHLIKLMTRRQILARVRFKRIEHPAAGRKQLAGQIHQEVVQLKDGGCIPP